MTKKPYHRSLTERTPTTPFVPFPMQRLLTNERISGDEGGVGDGGLIGAGGAPVKNTLSMKSAVRTM